MALWLGLGLLGRAEELAPQTLIICNETEPESRPLAEYYARQRQLSTNQIVTLRVRAAETITRREFRQDLKEPLLRELTRRGLLVHEPRTGIDGMPSLECVASRVSLLVPVYGLPLRVEADPTLAEPGAELQPKQMRRNEAAVDSELALLPNNSWPLTGALRNPFFNAAQGFAAPMNRRILLVGRLDGPDPATVRRMIDDALRAERFGVHGRAYFDEQASRDQGYAQGDAWIKNAAAAVRQAGYETELDNLPAVLPQDQPVSDVAIYAGWYAHNVTGPFRRDTFRFQPGAIAYHIHSSSAASLRTRTTYWAGPLLDRGAAATLGNVFEPYLMLTPHVDKFFERLLAGGTFIEAACASQPVLSWQTTFLGDPLYRPFAVSVDDQIARLAAEKRPALAWAYLRKINLLGLRGREAEALALCREQAARLNSPVLREKLGDLQDPAAAVLTFQQLLQQEIEPGRLLRLAMKLARAHQRNGQPALGLAVYEGLIAAHPQHSLQAEFHRRARDLADAAGLKEKTAALQKRLEQLLAPPPPPKP